MIGLLQRVSHAQVVVAEKQIATIQDGLVVLVGVEQNDATPQADRLLQRILGYRIFADNKNRMNRSLQDTDGGLLLVPQFTLVANTHKGMRPSFHNAAPPTLGQALFDYLVEQAKKQHTKVVTGRFGATMQLSLVNEGPVTFYLRVV